MPSCRLHPCSSHRVRHLCCRRAAEEQRAAVAAATAALAAWDAAHKGGDAGAGWTSAAAKRKRDELEARLALLGELEKAYEDYGSRRARSVFDTAIACCRQLAVSASSNPAATRARSHAFDVLAERHGKAASPLLCSPHLLGIGLVTSGIPVPPAPRVRRPDGAGRGVARWRRLARRA